MRIARPEIAYSLRGAEKATGVPVSSIQDAVQRGDLVPNNLGRKPSFRAVELDAWIASLPTECRL